MSRQKFVSERVFPSTSSATPEGIQPEMRLTSAEVQGDLLSHKTVCFLGHSIVDDLRILLEEHDSDLHRDFNLKSVIPLWKAVQGLNFEKLPDCLPFQDHRRCHVVVWQMTGNDLDSDCSVARLTEKYLQFAYNFIRYCGAETVIIYEALPRTRTRFCSMEGYAEKRHHFNCTMRQHLLVDYKKSGPQPTSFKDHSK